MLEIYNVLQKCGDCHRFQFVILIFFCIINLLSSMHYYSQTIISFVPKYSCLNNINETAALAVGQSYDNKQRATTIYRGINTNSMSYCRPNGCNKYVYDLYMGYKSITSELDWICDNAWKLTLGQSMFFIGSVVGTLMFGLLADYIGRLPILVVANMVAMCGNLLTIFGTTVVRFSIFHFISGLATDSNFVMMYILVMEYLRPSLRTIGLSICIGVFYCLGSMAAPWIAILMHTWRGFLIATSVPFIIVPFFYFIVPESVQWLISRQKYDRAVKCLKQVAKINGRQLDESIYIEFIDECQRKQLHVKSQPTLINLFATPRLRRNTLILFFKS